MSDRELLLEYTSSGETNNCQKGTFKAVAIAFSVFADASCFPLMILYKLTLDKPITDDNSLAVNPFSERISFILFSIN